MRTVTKREFDRHTARVLARVSSTDDDLVITERGAPRWRLSAYHETSAGLARLEQEGRYTPPMTYPPPWPTQAGIPQYTAAEADTLLAQMKGDH